MSSLIVFLRQHKLLIGVIVLLFVFCSVALLYYVVWYHPDIRLANAQQTVEYGTEVKIDPSKVLQTDNPRIIQTVKVDTTSFKYKKGALYPEVGTYRVPVTYVQKRATKSKDMTINVRDTAAPKVSQKEGVELNFEVAEKPPHYEDFFTIIDLSKTKLSVDDSKVIYTKPGKYPIIVSATDEYGNTQKITIDVTIVKAPEPQKGGVQATNNNQVTSPLAQERGLTYVQGILIVNKKHCLPQSYAPGEDATAGAAARRMIDDMQKNGLNISNSYSGYRSYEHQARVYQGYVSTYGQAQADTFSARPGCSEHQSGLAYDFLFGDGQLVTGGREAEWISNNAHRYGFIVRYLPGTQSITGYQAEPWHVRYVGDKAAAIRDSGLTLEQYLGVPGGDY